MAISDMKNGKATGPDNLQVEEFGTNWSEFLKEALNKLADEEKFPDIWRNGILIPIFKNKGDIMNDENYRVIKLYCRAKILINECKLAKWPLSASACSHRTPSQSNLA